jgi:uncharacterized membrane protein YozB (DUF420 family)
MYTKLDNYIFLHGIYKTYKFAIDPTYKLKGFLRHLYAFILAFYDKLSSVVVALKIVFIKDSK